MAREIKFRAWDTIDDDDTRMLTWEDLAQHRMYNIEHPDGFIYMQYTGLKDKNGVEIYEGDIVDDGMAPRPGEVYWDSTLAGFDTTSRQPDDNDDTPIIVNNNRLQVIGNIYENPELIQK